MQKSGPNGFAPATRLTESLVNLGFSVRRFKTGTPARVDGRTVNYQKCEVQHGDTDIYPFSFMHDNPPENKLPCYLTYTNLQTHGIILENLDRSPLYNGTIASAGPRYCPSIETKVVRFKDKERHQIFLEPEGADTLEVYVQGMSTSMPYDVQKRMYRSIAGLENADIMRYGYAIEYDCIDTLDILPTLEFKKNRRRLHGRTNQRHERLRRSRRARSYGWLERVAQTARTSALYTAPRRSVYRRFNRRFGNQRHGRALSYDDFARRTPYLLATGQRRLPFDGKGRIYGLG